MSKKIREVHDVVVDHESRIGTLETTGASNHNSLLNIDGGTTNEYYHLTNADYTDVTGFDFSGVTLDVQNISGSVLGTSTTFTGDVLNSNTSLDSEHLRHTNSELPHGFVNRTDSTISAVNGTFTIQPASTSYSYYYKSKRYDITGTQQIQYYSSAPAVTTTYFIYFNDNVLTSSTLAWSIRNTAPIAYVIYISNTGTNVIADERHGINMSTLTHEYLHLTRGTVYESGLALANYTLNSDAGLNYTVSAGVIYDEDIRISISEKTTDFKLLYRSGVDGVWSLYEANRLYNNGTDSMYNQYTGSTWQMTALTTNGVFFNYYLFATNLNSTFNIIIVPGQLTYSTSAAAIGENVRSLQLGSLPIQEIAPIVKITYDRRNTYGDLNYNTRIVNVEAIVSQSVTITQGIANHNSLSGLQANVAGQYYHLSENELLNLQNMSASVLGTSTTFTGDVLSTNLKSDNDTRLISVETDTKYLEGLEMFTTLTIDNAKSLFTDYLQNPPVAGKRYIDIAASSTRQILGNWTDGIIYYSNNDGVNWTQLTTLSKVHCVTYNSTTDKFYCYANDNNSIVIIDNSDLTITPSSTVGFTGVAHVEYYSKHNRFIAFRASTDFAFYSTDGISWTTCSGITTSCYSSIYSISDLRYRTLSMNRTTYYISEDLITWFAYSTSLSSSSAYYNPCYSQDLNILMCASNGLTPYLIFRNNTWTSYTAASNLSEIIYDPVSKLFFMIFMNGTITYSFGDDTWTTLTGYTLPTNDYYRAEIINDKFIYLFDEATSIIRLTLSTITKDLTINGDITTDNLTISGSLNGKELTNRSGYFNRYIDVSNSGLIEIGRYLDWHYNSNSSTDRTSRMTCDISGNVSFDQTFTATNVTSTNSTDISTVLTRTQNISASVLNTSTTFTGSLLSSNVTSTNSTDISTALTRTQYISASSNNTTITGTLNGLSISTGSGNLPFSRLVHIGNTGVLEGGRYFDWHFDTATADKSSRLQVTSTVGDLKFDRLFKVECNPEGNIGLTTAFVNVQDTYNGSSLNTDYTTAFRHQWTWGTANTTAIWSIAGRRNGGELHFVFNNNSAYDMYLNPNGTMGALNTTVTHLSISNDELQIGDCVEMTGDILMNVKDENGEIIFVINPENVPPTDCCPIVAKCETKNKKYCGVVVQIINQGEEFEYGDMMKTKLKSTQKCYKFASHGDCILKVPDSSIYEVGDMILSDYSIVDESTSQFWVNYCKVGKVTRLIDANHVAIFM